MDGPPDVVAAVRADDDQRGAGAVDAHGAAGVRMASVLVMSGSPVARRDVSHDESNNWNVNKYLSGHPARHPIRIGRPLGRLSRKMAGK